MCCSECFHRRIVNFKTGSLWAELCRVLLSSQWLVKNPGSILWTWEHKCQSVTQLNALLPSFKAVMIAYCRGEPTGKVEQLKCVYVWERVFVGVETHRNVEGQIERVCFYVCVQFDQPQQDHNCVSLDFAEHVCRWHPCLCSEFNVKKYHYVHPPNFCLNFYC